MYTVNLEPPGKVRHCLFGRPFDKEVRIFLGWEGSLCLGGCLSGGQRLAAVLLLHHEKPCARAYLLLALRSHAILFSQMSSLVTFSFL